MAETFSVTPQNIWNHKVEYRTEITKFESGKEQRKNLGALPRKWTLSFLGKWAAVEPVDTFFNARKGSFEAFNWTPPGASAAVLVRFENKSLDIERYYITGFASCRVTLVEVFP